MFSSRFRRDCATGFAASILALVCCSAPVAAQGTGGQPITFKVQGANERMEMTVNTSRILKLDQKIPRFVVNNPDMLKVLPLSATELQVAAQKPGVTQINMWTENGDIFSVDLIVYGDARELAMLLETEFPQSSLKVRPLANSVVISGYVDRPDHVSRIVRMAEDYYPKVINNISVGGVQQVLLHCKVLEVSRTKLRAMGFDFAALGSGGDFLISSVSGLISAAAVNTIGGGTSANVHFGVVGSESFFGFLEAMRRYNLAKIISEPTLVTVSGRPAYFEVGGEIPYEIPQSLGTTTIEFKKFGTRLDFVPIVLGHGAIRLEVRPRVSQLDESIGIPVGNRVVPGFKTRELDTGVELRAGQTLALAGLLEHRVEAENKGLPFLADLPWIGAGFRRVEEDVNEIELLVLVTPELVDGMDPGEVPPCGPGMSSVSPCDKDLYFKGHLEVPRCDGPCAMGGAGCGPNGCGPNGNGHAIPGGYGPAGGEEIAPPPAAARPNGNVAPEPPATRANGASMRLNQASNYNASPVAHTAPVVSQGVPSAVPTPVMARDRYNPQSPVSRYTQPSQSNSSQGPGLVGPMGYDVLD
jgi:pilus assembly protein CpaC